MKALPALFLLLLSLAFVSAETMAPPAPSAAPSATGTPATPVEKPKPIYIEAGFFEIDSLKKILGTFPAPESPESKADIDTLLKLQSARTPEQIARCASEVDLKLEAFAPIFGPWFDAKNLPITAALLKKATNDAKFAFNAAKDSYARPRPPLIDNRIQPCIELPKSAAYPSGHTTIGVSWSLILAELAPDLRKELLARGNEIGKDREIAGVHYPTDVKAGRKLGHELVKRFLKNPEFQSDLAKAKLELTEARHAAAAVK